MSYQYETSPRKYDIDYDDRPKKRKVKKPQKSKAKAKKVLSKKEQRRENFRFRFWMTTNVAIFLLLAFTISSRSALINQSFAEIQNLKSQVNDITKENDQLEINIQNSLNLNNIEQTAKDMLGMQKLTSKQTVYLNLPKKDYVEPSTEEIILEDIKSESFIDIIVNFFGNIF